MIESNGITNFDGIPGTGAVAAGPEANLWLGNVQEDGTASSRIFAGNHAAGDRLGSSNYCASRGTVLSGNSFSNSIIIGYMFSSVTITHPAESTRIRQHSGTITLASHANTSNQPSTDEVDYTWASVQPLSSSEVGPFADL